jgi:hypothetical protein
MFKKFRLNQVGCEDLTSVSKYAKQTKLRLGGNLFLPAFAILVRNGQNKFGPKIQFCC